MAIPLRRIGGLAAASVAALTLLGACVPPDKAVGDTQEKEPDVAFDGLDRGDVVIGFIGSDRPDFDRLALQAFEDSGLATSYLSVAEVEDPARAAQQGVRDMAARQVAIIVVSRLDIADDTADGWAVGSPGRYAVRGGADHQRPCGRCHTDRRRRDDHHRRSAARQGHDGRHAGGRVGAEPYHSLG